MITRSVNLTPIGKFLRKLRIDTDETAVMMSKKLNIQPTKLSAIELVCSRNSASEELLTKLYTKISKEYNLNEEKKNELKRAILLSKKNISINLCDKKSEDVIFIFDFIQKVEFISSEDKRKISEIINKYDDCFKI